MRSRNSLSEALGKPLVAEAESNWRAGARACVVTSEPEHALRAMAAAARHLGMELNPWVRDVDPMSHILRRLIADVS